jgi:hypothetical protein
MKAADIPVVADGCEWNIRDRVADHLLERQLTRNYAKQ